MEISKPEIGSIWFLKTDPTVSVSVINPLPQYKRKQIQYLYSDGNVGGYHSASEFYSDWSPATETFLPIPSLVRAKNIN